MKSDRKKRRKTQPPNLLPSKNSVQLLHMKVSASFCFSVHSLPPALNSSQCCTPHCHHVAPASSHSVHFGIPHPAALGSRITFTLQCLEVSFSTINLSAGRNCLKQLKLGNQIEQFSR